MFDKIRLFRVLHAIVLEENYFLLAQDLYCIFSSVLTQLECLESTIAEYNAKRAAIIEKGEGLDEAERYANGIANLSKFLQERKTWEDIISDFVAQAYECWYCAPVDSAKISRQHMTPLDHWILQSAGGFAVDEDARNTIDDIKSKCGKVLEEKFSEMLAEAREEIRVEQEMRSLLTNRKLKFGNFIPSGLIHEFLETNDSCVVVTNFPTTHFYIAQSKFAKLLRYSKARILAFPLLSFIVNTKETTNVVEKLNMTTVTSQSTTVIFYRTASRDVVAVRWEIATPHVDKYWVMAQGVEITKELELSRSVQAASMQTMLRQWLHSMRNASFEQQAQAIYADVVDIRSKLEDTSEVVKGQLDDVISSLQTLTYSTQSSLGFIDQALATKGLMASTNMASFVDTLALFASNFSQSEGIVDMPSSFSAYLNGNPATTIAFKDLYVGGDMMSIKILIDNIYSNAVRYTDLTKGVNCDVNVHAHGNIMQCVVNITDFCDGGLPESIVEYYLDQLGKDKLVDWRHKDCANPCLDSDFQPPIGSPSSFRNSMSGNSVKSASPKIKLSGASRSSLTGVPHIVDLYHKLTASGEQDFDMTITTQSSGTSFNVRFAVGLIAPPKADDFGVADEGMENMHLYMTMHHKVVLVVDDSAVVRRLLSRCLDRLGVPHHVCGDGMEAKIWLENNPGVCFGIITDLEMPRMAGDGLIRAAKSMEKDLPCVIVSGNNLSPENIPEGVSKVLLKPILLDQLKDILLYMYDQIH